MRSEASEGTCIRSSTHDIPSMVHELNTKHGGRAGAVGDVFPTGKHPGGDGQDRRCGATAPEPPLLSQASLNVSTHLPGVLEA